MEESIMSRFCLPIFDTNRGQAYIAEAIFAVVLLSGVMFIATTTLAIDEPALSAEERVTQTEIEADTHNIIEQSKQEGSLKASILNWDENEERYVGADGSEGNHLLLPTDDFGTRLNTISKMEEDSRELRVNVKITPSQNKSGTESSAFNHTRPESYPFIQRGDAPNTMVTVDTYVTLYGDDQFQLPPRAHRTEHTQAMGANTETQLADIDEDDEFPIPPASSYDEVGEDDVYNVVNVQVIVWAI